VERWTTCRATEILEEDQTLEIEVELKEGNILPKKEKATKKKLNK